MALLRAPESLPILIQLQSEAASVEFRENAFRQACHPHGHGAGGGRGSGEGGGREHQLMAQILSLSGTRTLQGFSGRVTIMGPSHEPHCQAMLARATESVEVAAEVVVSSC